jgi:hypothetical protein
MSAVDTKAILEKAQIISAYCDDLAGGERLNMRYLRRVLWGLIAAAPGVPGCYRFDKAERLKATMTALISAASMLDTLPEGEGDTLREALESRVTDLVSRAEAEVGHLFQPRWRGNAS